MKFLAPLAGSCFLILGCGGRSHGSATAGVQGDAGMETEGAAPGGSQGQTSASDSEAPPPPDLTLRPTVWVGETDRTVTFPATAFDGGDTITVPPDGLAPTPPEKIVLILDTVTDSVMGTITFGDGSPPPPAAHERKAGKPAEVETQQLPADTPSNVKAERTVLPPLEVEVVAGNQRVTLPGKNPAIHVDVGMGGTMPSTPSQSAAATADGHVELSPQIQQRLAVAVPPDYPLLARQMKVQGAVSLQALIARDGAIQELQILSGPEILATAAREAVKQWHFKPYLQNGQPVETQARITVNFTISTN